MARFLVGTVLEERELRQQLIACDPHGVQTSVIALKKDQGLVRIGTLLTEEEREIAAVATQVAGISAFTVHTDDLPEDTAVTVCTAGRFLWKAIREANPSVVFDPTAIATLKSKQISFEPTFSGVGNYWIGQP